jgi:predicted ATPase/DNA-binding winged helix-turn-helix (wHTH) protein
MRESYRFGAVEIRPVERQVLIDGRPAVPGSRAFDVLLALVEHRDRVMTKNELLDLAWPGLVVEENNLQAQVSALRRLLGPQAIATIPGRGYRFTMPESPDANDTRPAQAAVDTSHGGHARRGLPRLLAPLLGREDELAALARILEQHRLVTLSGAAGIGKTSVAIAAAEERLEKLRDGAAWVDLGAIADASLVPAAMAQALQVQATPGADVRGALMAALLNLEALLVVDNAEHVLDAVAELVDAILAQAPGVAVLVTSRSALKLRQERLMRLGPLGVPEGDAALDEARTFGAVALLEARAKAVDPRFVLDDENVALAIDICRHLDGIALAIELAAARLPLLGMRGLAERINERFRLLASATRLVPTRQQTLLAALDWSHDLLSAEEQKIFRRLGIFPGDFSLALATAVARDESTDEWAVIDVLGALVDRSLVEVDSGAVPRYRLLESARAYALLKLDAAELRATQRAFACAMLDLFDKAQSESWTRPEPDWLAAYGAELDNMRAAIDWSTQHDRALAVALLGSAHFLFSVRGLERELRGRCESVEPDGDLRIAPQIEAGYWLTRAQCMRTQREQSRVFASKAAELYRQIGDGRMRYVALGATAFAQTIEVAERTRAEMDKLERPDWPPRVLYTGIWSKTHICMRAGSDEAPALLERSLELARACGSESLVRRTLGNMADHALSVGDTSRAVRIGRELLASTPASHYQVLVIRGNLANALLQEGEVAEARAVIAGFLELSRAVKWEGVSTFAAVFSLLAASEGRYESAARLLGFAERWQEALGGRPEPNEQHARDLAFARVDQELGAAAREPLMAEGRALDEEAACALTLEPAGSAVVTLAGGRRRPSWIESLS